MAERETIKTTQKNIEESIEKYKTDIDLVSYVTLLTKLVKKTAQSLTIDHVEVRNHINIFIYIIIFLNFLFSFYFFCLLYSNPCNI